MADVTLTDTERKVLSYVARGVSKDKAVEKISQFFSMQANDVIGVLGNLKRQGLVIESNSIASTITVLTTSPLKVKRAMLDPTVIENLSQKEHGTRAGALKRATYTQDLHTGEIRDTSQTIRNAPSGQSKKPAGVDLGFELE